jgi:flagellar basal body-associated protein FliL
MADPTQPAQATPAGETPAESTPAKAGGLSSYLPLIIAIVVMPVAAYVTLTVKAKMAKKSTETTEETHDEPTKAEAKEAHGGGHGSSKEKKTTVLPGVRNNVKLPVPLTRDAVAYVEKDKDKPSDTAKIVTLDIKGETKDLAQSDKIVVNVAGTGGSRYLLVRISLVSDHPSFIERLNENRERLIDTASGTLQSKTLDDLNRPGYRSLLKSELQGLFNQQLGSAMIQEVLIHEFVIQ